MKNDISQTIVRLLSEITQREIKLANAADSDCFLKDLGLDSMVILRLIMDIERAFDIKIKNSELDLQLFSDFNKLVTFVGARLDEKACRSID